MAKIINDIKIIIGEKITKRIKDRVISKKDLEILYISLICDNIINK